MRIVFGRVTIMLATVLTVGKGGYLGMRFPKWERNHLLLEQGIRLHNVLDHATINTIQVKLNQGMERLTLRDSNSNLILPSVKPR